MIARNEADLKAVQSEISNQSGKAFIWPFDLTSINEIDNLVNLVDEKMGSIDVLINNAGINIAKPAEELSSEDWDKVMDINLKSTFFLSKSVGKHMASQAHGKI